MSSRLAAIAESFFKPAVRDIVPYEPGKPVDEVQRELGLERVVKLASNEGPFGPFPEALDALAETATDLNRYPDGGGYRLRMALAERHDVRLEEIAVGAGADGVVDCLAQTSLDRGDNVVCGWPSFPSYVITARKLGAEARTIPLREGRYDLDAMLEAVTELTKLVYICHPNNPTGTMNTRAELDDYFGRVPDHVVTVIDQAYFEYVEEPEYPDGIEEYLKRGRRVVVLRTFSKIFGLAGLRVGYAAAPAEVVTAIGKVRRAFDVTSPAQIASVASLTAPGAEAEIQRRRRVNAEGRPLIEEALREHGFDPVGPAVANFVFAEVGEDSRPLFERLLQEGVIVRPTAGFGALGGIRVTVGTPDENAYFRKAFGRVLASAPT